MDTRRELRRAGAVALVAVLAAVGCSGEDDTGSATTSIAGDGTSEGIDPDGSVTTTTVSDEEFSEAMAAFSSLIGEAGTDMCALIDVTGRTPPPRPSNPEQTEQVVYLVADILRAYGASAVEAPELAAGFDRMADGLVAEAEAAGFTPEFLDGQPASLTSEEAAALQGRFSELAETNCAQLDPENIDGTDGQP